jgi:hypothetical protein
MVSPADKRSERPTAGASEIVVMSTMSLPFLGHGGRSTTRMKLPRHPCSWLPRSPAAIDGDRGAGDLVCRSRTQEGDRAAELRRRGEIEGWLLFGKKLFGRFLLTDALMPRCAAIGPLARGAVRPTNSDCEPPSILSAQQNGLADREAVRRRCHGAGDLLLLL